MGTSGYVENGGVRIYYEVHGSGVPILLHHGFTSSAEDWHRFGYVGPLAERFTVVLMDARGHGKSDKPHDPRLYTMDLRTDDVRAVLDALGIERAALVGHDWGAIVMWMVAVMHPERVERVASLNVPYRGRPGFPPTARLREMVEAGAQQFNYVLVFQEPGRAEAIFAQDMAGRLRRLYEGVAGRPDFLSDEDFQVYLRAFQEGGLTGPLNYYRNVDRNWETTQHLHERQVTCPALLVMTDRDPVLRPEMAEGMERWVPRLRLETVRDCGHWTQQERPQEVNRLLLEFLGDLGRR
jgi:pimeloyl-ACP methyl ester carboxylesterase